MCVTYCILTFCCFDVSTTSWGRQTMMSLTDISMTSKLDIYQTKQPMSQYVSRTSETDIRKWHIPDQSSDVHTTSLNIRSQCQKLTYPGPSLWRPQNLHGTSGSNVSDWRLQDVHWTSGIDVSYQPKLDQSPDILMTSTGRQQLMSVIGIDWTKSLMSPGHLPDVRPWCQYLTYPG